MPGQESLERPGPGFRAGLTTPDLAGPAPVSGTRLSGFPVPEFLCSDTAVPDTSATSVSYTGDLQYHLRKARGFLFQPGSHTKPGERVGDTQADMSMSS